MFKVGDKVVDAYWAGNEGKIVTGTVRGCHQRHYLVQWEKGPMGRRCTHEIEKDLLPADSPAIPLLVDIGKKKANLEAEIERLHAEAEAIIKSARGKEVKGRQAEQAEGSDQDSQGN